MEECLVKDNTVQNVVGRTEHNGLRWHNYHTNFRTESIYGYRRELYCTAICQRNVGTLVDAIYTGACIQLFLYFNRAMPYFTQLSLQEIF